MRQTKSGRSMPHYIAMLLILLCVAGYNPLRTEAAEMSGKSITAQIPVSCEKTDTKEVFHYNLTYTAPAKEQIENAELTLKSGEKGYFRITYNNPGTYHYTVSQTTGTDKATTYDTTVYHVDTYVTEAEDGSLSVEPVLYKEGAEEKKEELTFQNIRKITTKQPKTARKTMKKVKTGDTANLPLWTVLLICSGIGVLTGICRRMKKRREDRANA